MSSGIRALFLLRSFTLGGAERQLATLLPRLAAHGVEAHVAVFYGDGPLERQVRESGVPVIHLGKTGKWDIVGFLRSWMRTVREVRPDVLVGWMPVENLFVLAAGQVARRSGVVWSLRGSTLEPAAYDRVTRCAFWLEGALLRCPRLVIANSHAGLAAKHLRATPARYVVIENGIDTARFRYDLEGRIRVREALGVSDAVPLIGIVGRLAPQKDHRTFLETAVHIATRLPAARFVVVGEGPDNYAESLRAHARDIGIAERVIWYGATTEMPAVLSALDVVVSASSFGEGTHNVLLEAMSCGLPVASTDVGDARQVVGSLGAVVPSRRPDLLSDAVLHALERRGAADRTERRQHVERVYGVDVFAQRMAYALRDTLRR